MASAVDGPITHRSAVNGDLDLRSVRRGILLELPNDARFHLDAEAERGEVLCDFNVNDSATSSPEAPAPRIVLHRAGRDPSAPLLSRIGVP